MKKIMKKLIMGYLLLAMILVCAVGCGKKEESTTIRVGGMKGPTSMGLMFLQEKDAKAEALEDYEFQMVTAADELLP